MLARIIWCEERAEADAQTAVAKVIKNRSTTVGYYELEHSYPQASIWARVIGKNNHYASANNSVCCKPIRGDASRSDGIDIYWKKAVDLATKLKNNVSFSVPNGYLVNSSGTVASTKTTAVDGQLNQVATSLFRTYLNGGHVQGPAITYKSGTLSGNVFFTYV